MQRIGTKWKRLKLSIELNTRIFFILLLFLIGSAVIGIGATWTFLHRLKSAFSLVSGIRVVRDWNIVKCFVYYLSVCVLAGKQSVDKSELLKLCKNFERHYYTIR